MKSFISSPWFWRYIFLFFVMFLLLTGTLIGIQSIDCPVEGTGWSSYYPERTWYGACK